VRRAYWPVGSFRIHASISGAGTAANRRESVSRWTLCRAGADDGSCGAHGGLHAQGLGDLEAVAVDQPSVPNPIRHDGALSESKTIILDSERL
jgi:hypothetical protein